MKTSKKAVKKMNAVRNLPTTGTCPVSRHVAMMAEELSKDGFSHCISDDTDHAACSIAVVVTLLWEARARLAELEQQTP